MSLIHAYQSRGLTRDITINDVDGNAITPGTNDQIRVIIGHEGKLGTNNADAKLVVASNAPTSDGSTFTKNSPSTGVNRLRIDASDLTFEPGTYTLFVDYFDNADTQEWKNVDRQCFVLERT